MSGRWLFFERPGRGPERPSDHFHARIAFADGAALWFEDPRRFGLLRTIATARAGRDRALATLGPDPLATPPTGAGLAALGRGARVSVKTFLLDQKRIAGIGNIYASEILPRAGVDPRRPAGRLSAGEWERVAALTRIVLDEAVERMGTTFRTYRTLWTEPGAYGERLLVYDRAGEPCRACGTAVRRIVQGGRSSYFCPVCQPRTGRRRPEGRSGAPPGP